jgi:hypothetical protein
LDGEPEVVEQFHRRRRQCRSQSGGTSAGKRHLEIGGPEQSGIDELVRRRLASLNDPRNFGASSSPKNPN